MFDQFTETDTTQNTFLLGLWKWGHSVSALHPSTNLSMATSVWKAFKKEKAFSRSPVWSACFQASDALSWHLHQTFSISQYSLKYYQIIIWNELQFMWSFLSTWTEAESTKLNFKKPTGEVERVKRINTFKTGWFLLRSTYFICFFLGSNWFLLSYTRH